jgi:hypothetical protein
MYVCGLGCSQHSQPPNLHEKPITCEHLNRRNDTTQIVFRHSCLISSPTPRNRHGGLSPYQSPPQQQSLKTPDFAKARSPRITDRIPNQPGPANGDNSLGHLPKPISSGDDKLLTFAELANRIRLD